MKTYIAILRGINVSDQKKIKMADLRALLDEIGFKEVQTYIQSGNIVFQYPETSESDLEKIIEEKIQSHYDFHVPTMVRTPEAFQYVINHNPFLQDPEKDIKRQYITFLAEQPAEENIEALKEVDHDPEEYIIDGRVIFFFSPNGYGRAKMNNNFFEKKLKVKATTRNWKTVNKLLEMTN
jgi:uncharacterized protein (DUF1697 family)